MPFKFGRGTSEEPVVLVHPDVIEHFRRDFMAQELNVAARRQFDAMCNQALRAYWAEKKGEPEMKCPYCERVMSVREKVEQGACNDCYER